MSLKLTYFEENHWFEDLSRFPFLLKIQHVSNFVYSCGSPMNLNGSAWTATNILYVFNISDIICNGVGGI